MLCKLHHFRTLCVEAYVALHAHSLQRSHGDNVPCQLCVSCGPADAEIVDTQSDAKLSQDNITDRNVENVRCEEPVQDIVAEHLRHRVETHLFDVCVIALWSPALGLAADLNAELLAEKQCLLGHRRAQLLADVFQESGPDASAFVAASAVA